MVRTHIGANLAKAYCKLSRICQFYSEVMHDLNKEAKFLGKSQQNRKKIEIDILAQWNEFPDGNERMA